MGITVHRPSWYVVVGDEERGYVPDDEVHTCVACSGLREVLVVPALTPPWDDSHGVVVECGACDGDGHWLIDTGERCEPANCSGCGRELSYPTPRPLCIPCDTAARAHGSLDAERMRQDAVGG